MSTTSAIMQAARERADDLDLPYSGAVTPSEAWTLAQHLPNVKIVDVRTHPEWQFVGVVPNAELIEWKRYPRMERNEDFLARLRQAVDPESVVLFLCRSGVRSHDAAAYAAANGYAESFNILEGFEGSLDGAQHRGQINGWKAHGLPWVQS